MGIRWLAAVYDGKYIYSSPYEDTTGVFSGAVERFDTAGTFTGSGQGGAWTSYDLAASVDTNAMGFDGAIFDGRYLYLVPYEKTIAVRYDTQAQFDSPSSWSKIDLANVNPAANSYAGGTFDGRYVYFVPYGHTPSGIAIRYDTQQTFTTTSSWQIFDVTTKDSAAKAFQGAAFDGRYVYFVPRQGTVTVRFDAKSPPSLPPFTPSFF